MKYKVLRNQKVTAIAEAINAQEWTLTHSFNVKVNVGTFKGTISRYLYQTRYYTGRWKFVPIDEIEESLLILTHRDLT